MKMRLMTLGPKDSITEKVTQFKKRDQFSAEILFFSNCILNNVNPEPSAAQGLADVKVIEAIYKSIRHGKPVTLNTVVKLMYPSPRMEMNRPGIKKRKTYHATGPKD
jgi:hypothetical protein